MHLPLLMHPRRVALLQCPIHPRPNPSLPLSNQRQWQRLWQRLYAIGLSRGLGCM